MKSKLTRMMASRKLWVLAENPCKDDGYWFSIEAESELVGVADRSNEYGWHAVVFNDEYPKGRACFVSEVEMFYLVGIPL